jgi:hypothetical protein
MKGRQVRVKSRIVGSVLVALATMAGASATALPAYAAKHHRHKTHHVSHGIPQHNGGDRDGDNNGAPSDGDGNA